MNKILLTLFLISFIISNNAYGHKLIDHDDSHIDFESALKIPDHKISWAIYENLGTNEAKYYTFEAKKGESLYASIVIPKLEELEQYAPTLLLVGNENKVIKKIPYEKGFPGREFYEPFGQVTYWERQELKIEIPADGKYFLVVVDEKNQSGKYSLAVGTIEDFSIIDFFTTLPKAWIATKIFVNDFAILSILLVSLFATITIPTIIKIKKIKIKQNSFT